MKKYIVFVFFILLVNVCIFSQTWTKRVNVSDKIGEVDYTYSVITKQQYDRLLNSHTVNEEYAVIQFQDVLEQKEQGRIINGTVPTFKGYYYLLCEINPITKDGKEIMDLLGMKTAICYGNSETGICVIMFCNVMATLDVSANVFQLGSNTFIERYNRVTRVVNGE